MTPKQSPLKRQEAIRAILSAERVADQKQLVQLLAERYGIETNQAVVSRDLRRLNVVKREVNQVMVYELPKTNVTEEILQLAIIDIQHNESLIVITTPPGLADFVGDCLDQHSDLRILGCLSGENVVFVTPQSTKEIAQVYRDVCLKLNFKQKRVLDV